MILSASAVIVITIVSMAICVVLMGIMEYATNPYPSLPVHVLMAAVLATGNILMAIENFRLFLILS